MKDTVKRIMELVEAYRTAGGREEHWARKDALEAELTRLFTPLSDEVILAKWMDGRVPVLNFAREIEAMHKIGGES